MALSSASPQIANVKDGDKSPPGDLEEGEIEDGELPDEEGEGEVANLTKTKGEHSTVTSVNTHRPTLRGDKLDKIDKPNEIPLGRGSRRKALHHNSDRSNELEEDWACAVEKKLKAAMGKDISNEKINGSPNVSVSEKPATVAVTVTDDDKKNRRKKRKKKHKDEEEEDRKDAKKRKKNHHWDAEGGHDVQKEKVREGDEGDEDDDEMLFVRGASPIMREVFGGEESKTSKYAEKSFPFNPQGGYDEHYESYNEEESDFDGREDFNRCNPPLSDEEAPKRGLGRGAKRRQKAVGRILTLNKRQTRKDTKNKRGGIKRQQSARSNSDREPNVCMFFMQGKCQKGDECPYSHNACPPRKMELCKFYLMDCCAKKDKCLYMHHDFPCKFFHTGLKCFSGPRCKFSHGHLSDAMRSILLKGTEGNRHNELRLSNRPSVPSQEHRSKHLETAPKDLLGDFPRLSREGAAAMVYNKKNRGNKTKKIPSLFDIEVPIPAQILAEQKEASKDQSPRRTPMPESDNEDQDGTTTPMPQSPVNDNKIKGKSQRWGSDDVQGSLSKDSKDEENPTAGDDDGNKCLVINFYQETDTDSGNKKKNDKECGKLNLHRFAGYSPNPEDEKKSSLESSSDKSQNEDKESSRKADDKKSQYDTSNGDSGTESNDAANIPLHLPKKQRELFLRIQQQQREAESSQDQSGDHDDDIDVIPEENWYSSDDEEDSLTNVLKNLSRQNQQSVNQHDSSVCTSSEAKTDKTGVATSIVAAVTVPTTATTSVATSAAVAAAAAAAVVVATSTAVSTTGSAAVTTAAAAAATTTITTATSSTTTSVPIMTTVAGTISATAAAPATTITMTVATPSSAAAVAATTAVVAAAPLSSSTSITHSHAPAAAPPAAAAASSSSSLPLKIPDLSKIKIDESFTKLLSSICGKSTSDDSSAPLGSSLEQHTQSTSAGVARDPRLSRDPRSRNQTSGSATSSATGVFTTVSETVTTSSSTSTSTTLSSSFESSRRTDPRRIHDPRSAKSSHKSEGHDHKHSGSVSGRRSSSHSSTSFPSIYSNAIMGDKTSTHSGGLGLSIGGTTTGDVDLRSFLPRTLETGDVDLRSRGDTDLRTGQPPAALSFGDTDLRVRSHDIISVTQMDSGRNNSDVDLRMLELPFKPVPMHTPATEIEASLTSHPPIPYKVVVVTIPRPDYTSLKLNTSDPQVQSDPRLRKIFKLQPPMPENQVRSSLGSSVMTVSRNDPRRQPSRSGSSSNTGSGGSSGSGNNSCNTSCSVPVSTEHHENVSENFSATQTSHVITKPANEICNASASLLPNLGMRSSISAPTSSPLLPNPTPRIGRDPRSAPGLLGPAPLPANYCPNTPLFEEQVDMASGMDSDPRVMFSRGSVNGARWEQPSPSSAHLPRNNWRNNRRNQQSRYVEQEYNPRSYTPPI